MKNILFICLFLFIQIGFANDSLIQVINTTEDIDDKLKAMSSLAWELRRSDIHASDSIAQLTMEMANTPDLESHYYNALNTRGVLDLMRGEMQKGVKKLEKCSDYNLRNKNHKAYIDNQMNIALTYYFKGHLDSSTTVLQSLYSLADSLAIETVKIQLLHNLSIFYSEQGKYFEAIQTSLESIKVSEQQGDIDEISSNYNTLGLIYDYLGNLEKSKYYHSRSLQLALENDNLNSASASYGNLGEVHRQLNQWDSAYYYYNAALEVDRKIGDSLSIIGQMLNLSVYYHHINDLAKALEITQQALKASQRKELGYQTSLALNMLGLIYLDLGELEKSESALKSSLELGGQQNINDIIQANYKSLYKLYSKSRNADSALFYLEKSVELDDSLKNIKAKEKVDLLETQYRTSEKEKRIANLNALNIEKELRISRQFNWIVGLSSAAVLIALFSLFWVQKNKRKAQAEKDAAIIAERDKGTKAVFSAQEEERKRISKDLHDGVGQQLSGLKMAFQKLAKDIEKTNPEWSEQANKLSAIVSESADEVRSISHQMMPKALIELGLIQALEDMLSKSLNINDIQYSFEHFGINNRLNEKIEISIYRVAQELINNIIKHSESTKVSLQLFKNAGKLVFIVEDNGRGLNDTSGDGHGLLNMKSRINSLNGELNLEPSPGSGTLATIRIPLD